ncbi:unnamed protein product [Coregonus sp. 'balchen']|nr:unnamed protein product [Coregonus sp. 'balchen']
MSYTADEQCQILFGATASHCQNMQVSEALGNESELHRCIRNAATSKASSCILQTDPLSLNSVILPFKHPGMSYTADEQCQILFGATASHCQNMQRVRVIGAETQMESGAAQRGDGEA